MRCPPYKIRDYFRYRNDEEEWLDCCSAGIFHKPILVQLWTLVATGAIVFVLRRCAVGKGRRRVAPTRCSIEKLEQTSNVLRSVVEDEMELASDVSIKFVFCMMALGGVRFWVGLIRDLVESNLAWNVDGWDFYHVQVLKSSNSALVLFLVWFILHAIHVAQKVEPKYTMVFNALCFSHLEKQISGKEFWRNIRYATLTTGQRINLSRFMERKICKGIGIEKRWVQSVDDVDQSNVLSCIRCLTLDLAVLYFLFWHQKSCFDFLRSQKLFKMLDMQRPVCFNPGREFNSLHDIAYLCKEDFAEEMDIISKNMVSLDSEKPFDSVIERTDPFECELKRKLEEAMRNLEPVLEDHHLTNDATSRKKEYAWFPFRWKFLAATSINQPAVHDALCEAIRNFVDMYGNVVLSTLKEYLGQFREDAFIFEFLDKFPNHDFFIREVGYHGYLIDHPSPFRLVNINADFQACSQKAINVFLKCQKTKVQRKHCHIKAVAAFQGDIVDEWLNATTIILDVHEGDYVEWFEQHVAEKCFERFADSNGAYRVQDKEILVDLESLECRQAWYCDGSSGIKPPLNCPDPSFTKSIWFCCCAPILGKNWRCWEMAVKVTIGIPLISFLCTHLFWSLILTLGAVTFVLFSVTIPCNHCGVCNFPEHTVAVHRDLSISETLTETEKVHAICKQIRDHFSGVEPLPVTSTEQGWNKYLGYALVTLPICLSFVASLAVMLYVEPDWFFMAFEGRLSMKAYFDCVSYAIAELNPIILSELVLTLL